MNNSNFIPRKFIKFSDIPGVPKPPDPNGGNLATPTSSTTAPNPFNNSGPGAVKSAPLPDAVASSPALMVAQQNVAAPVTPKSNAPHVGNAAAITKQVPPPPESTPTPRPSTLAADKPDPRSWATRNINSAAGYLADNPLYRGIRNVTGGVVDPTQFGPVPLVRNLTDKYDPNYDPVTGSIVGDRLITRGGQLVSSADNTAANLMSAGGREGEGVHKLTSNLSEIEKSINDPNSVGNEAFQVDRAPTNFTHGSEGASNWGGAFLEGAGAGATFTAPLGISGLAPKALMRGGARTAASGADDVAAAAAKTVSPTPPPSTASRLATDPNDAAAMAGRIRTQPGVSSTKPPVTTQKPPVAGPEPVPPGTQVPGTAGVPPGVTGAADDVAGTATGAVDDATKEVTGWFGRNFPGGTKTVQDAFYGPNASKTYVEQLDPIGAVGKAIRGQGEHTGRNLAGLAYDYGLAPLARSITQTGAPRAVMQGVEQIGQGRVGQGLTNLFLKAPAYSAAGAYTAYNNRDLLNRNEQITHNVSDIQRDLIAESAQKNLSGENTGAFADLIREKVIPALYSPVTAARNVMDGNYLPSVTGQAKAWYGEAGKHGYNPVKMINEVARQSVGGGSSSYKILSDSADSSAVATKAYELMEDPQFNAQAKQLAQMDPETAQAVQAVLGPQAFGILGAIGSSADVIEEKFPGGWNAYQKQMKDPNSNAHRKAYEQVVKDLRESDPQGNYRDYEADLPPGSQYASADIPESQQPTVGTPPVNEPAPDVIKPEPVDGGTQPGSGGNLEPAPGTGKPNPFNKAPVSPPSSPETAPTEDGEADKPDDKSPGTEGEKKEEPKGFLDRVSDFWSNTLDDNGRLLVGLGLGAGAVGLLMNVFGGDDDDEDGKGGGSSWFTRLLPFLGLGAAAWGLGGGTFSELPSWAKLKGNVGSIFGGAQTTPAPQPGEQPPPAAPPEAAPPVTPPLPPIGTPTDPNNPIIPPGEKSPYPSIMPGWQKQNAVAFIPRSKVKLYDKYLDVVLN